MSLLQHVLKAACFDARVYSAIGDRPEAMFRSLAVVAATGIASGIGIQGLTIEGRDESPAILMLLTFSTAIIGWLLWATVVYLLGTRLLGGQAGYRDLMRSLGMVYGPGLLLAFIAIPSVGGTLWLVSLAWMLGAGTIAIREVQGWGTMRALGPAGIGWTLAHILLPAIVLAPNPAS